MRVDGYLAPGGETESAINKILSAASDPENGKEDEEKEKEKEKEKGSGKEDGGGSKDPEKKEPDEDKKKNCEDEEILWINAQGAYEVAKDNLEKAETELQGLEKKLTDLEMLRKKEMSNISGDKGKARGVGALVGMAIGGKLAGLQGAGFGIGAGANLGAGIEEAVDFITNKKTTTEIDNDIKATKDQMSVLKNKIKTELKPTVLEAKKGAEEARQVYMGCRGKDSYR